MRGALAHLLACPACGGMLSLTVEAESAGHVESGRLDCEACGRDFSVRGGVPRLTFGAEALADVARAFSYQWDAYHRGALTTNGAYGMSDADVWSLFLRGTAMAGHEVHDAVVLDAGCGHAQLSHLLVAHGAGTVIALDLSDSVTEVYEHTRHYLNVLVVQGDLLHPPLRRACDVVWSEGVVHMTPDARAAVLALASLVKPGGLLYVWMYADRFDPFVHLRAAVRAIGLLRMPEPALFRMARILSYPAVAAHITYRAIRAMPPFRPTSELARHRSRPLDRRWFHMRINDVLVPPFTSVHTELEVEKWLEEAGCHSIAALPEPKVGVRGRAPDDVE